MTPWKLVDWGIAITICIFLLSATGIQDWIAQLFGRRSSRKALEDKIAALEARIVKLEHQDK